MLLFLLLNLPEKSYKKHLAGLSFGLLRKRPDWSPPRMDTQPLGPSNGALPVLHEQSPFFLQCPWEMGSALSGQSQGLKDSA